VAAFEQTKAQITPRLMFHDEDEPDGGKVTMFARVLVASRRPR
jgi:hypothetical protein